MRNLLLLIPTDPEVQDALDNFVPKESSVWSHQVDQTKAGGVDVSVHMCSGIIILLGEKNSMLEVSRNSINCIGCFMKIVFSKMGVITFRIDEFAQ